MKANAIIFVLAMLAAMFPGEAQADSGDAGYFSCPSGQTEDIGCAAQCCEQQGGSYDYAQETCVVETQSQWNAAAACESESGCCVGNETTAGETGGSCCAPAAALLLAGIAAVFIRR